MALLEAMACGLPVVSFACDSGPAEIVRDGTDGLLVPPDDVPRLADALDRLMSDDALRQQLAHRAQEVARRFSREMFFSCWDAILNGISEIEFAKLA
jgi:glycosyltransferase involved in cell wall biosynthesis